MPPQWGESRTSNPYHVIHQVLDGRDAQHHEQGEQGGVPCQGRDFRYCLPETQGRRVPMEAWPLQVTANSNFPRHLSLRPAEPGGKERHPSLQPTFFLLPSPASDLQEQIPEDDAENRLSTAGCPASGLWGSQDGGQDALGSGWKLLIALGIFGGHGYWSSWERGCPPRRPCPLEDRLQVGTKDWEASLVKISCNPLWILRPHNVVVKRTISAEKFLDPNPVLLSHLGLWDLEQVPVPAQTPVSLQNGGYDSPRITEKN